MDDGDEVLEGFSGCARAINKAFSLDGDAGLDRRDLDRWARRGTPNADGEPPPRPVRALKHVKRTQPRLLYRPADWIAWVRPGILASHASQHGPFETPAERKARYRPPLTR